MEDASTDFSGHPQQILRNDSFGGLHKKSPTIRTIYYHQFVNF